MQGFLDALASILITEVRDESSLPRCLAVAAVYPNPFNATCTIELSIPAAEPVTLSIYSLAGRKVRALATGRLEPGVHRVTWDGCDYAGRTVASGIYVLNLVQGEFAVVSRVSLVK